MIVGVLTTSHTQYTDATPCGYSNGSIVYVDMDVVGVMAAYLL